MVRDNAVPKFGRTLLGEVRNLCNRRRDHLAADHNVTEQLSLVGVGIFRKSRELAGLSDVVTERRGNQEVPVQNGVVLTVVVAESRDT